MTYVISAHLLLKRGPNDDMKALNLKSRVRNTMFLVIAGSLISFSSFFLGYVDDITGKQVGFEEFYPFFHWRLYGDPKGTDGAATYRVYSKNAPGEAWHRHKMQATSSYTRSHNLLQLNVVVAGLLDDTNATAKDEEKLIAYIDHTIQPHARYYRVVRESYVPLDLFANPTAYDTTHVFALERGASGLRIVQP